MFLLVLLKSKLITNNKELVLTTTLLFSVAIVSITELLSVFNSLNLIFIACTWGVIALSLLFILLKDIKGTFATIMNTRLATKKYYGSLTTLTKSSFFFLLFASFVLLIQGVFYPPNNWDSLTYHMSRIMYWLSNESVSHFPTHILRHLYQPPFTEYFILQLNLLNGNDYLSNSVQWFFMILAVISICAVLDYFNVSRSYKLLAAFLAISIPAVELQSSTPKNDIVCGFFIITALFYAIKIYHENKLSNFLFLGLAIGLAFLTKGTAYLFLAPILVLLAIFILLKSIKNKTLKPILFGLLALFVALTINFGHYSRNYKVNKSILNVDEVESKFYANEKMDFKLLVSNLLKNAGLHLGYPFQKESDDLIRGIHKKMGVSIDNPQTNYLSIPYEGAKQFCTHEDLVANTIHFILVFFAIFTIIISAFSNFKKNKKIVLLLSILLLQIILFSTYLKWQPWNTRLHIPIFLLAVPVLILAAKISKLFKYLLLIALPFLVYSFCFYAVYNNTRPFIKSAKYTKVISYKDSRFKKYFTNQPQLYKEYKDVLEIIYANNPHKVGLMMSDWEYPLFHNFYYENIKIRAINVTNVTNIIPQNTANIEAIISNNPGKTDFIIFEGKKYKNQTPNHSYLYYFK